MIRTWEQLTFGGNTVMFHSETISTTNLHVWECDDDPCDACHTYFQNKQHKETQQ